MPTVTDLGQAIKRKHPGAYDDLDDADLGRKVRAKYPAYEDYEDEEPIPEAPDSLAIQLEQLVEGKRRVVLFTPGAKIPAKPAGMNRLDTDQGVFFYDPQQIGARSIKRAIAFGRLGEILGGPQGYGAPEKGELRGPQIAVTAKQGGKDVQAVASDKANLPRAIAAARQVGDSVQVEDPKQALLRRITDQAKQGIEINRGSSTDVPLNAEGHSEAAQDAQRIAKHAPPDRIVSSDSVRATQTAAEISKRSGVPVRPTANLESWAQGDLEGRPAKAVESQVDELLRDGRKVPNGQGPATKRAGESFDAFCRRYLGEMAQIMAEWRRDPTKRIVIVCHSQGEKVLRGWLAKGGAADYSIDKAAMRKSSGDPGSAQLLRTHGGKWTMAPADLTKPPAPGILIVRHSSTAWNKPS